MTCRIYWNWLWRHHTEVDEPKYIVLSLHWMVIVVVKYEIWMFKKQPTKWHFGMGNLYSNWTCRVFTVSIVQIDLRCFVCLNHFFKFHETVDVYCCCKIRAQKWNYRCCSIAFNWMTLLLICIWTECMYAVTSTFIKHCPFQIDFRNMYCLFEPLLQLHETRDEFFLGVSFLYGL